jgi:2-amino-4-hydroxy-6-hydroxymethyldihydropteridine diphosphokinase
VTDPREVSVAIALGSNLGDRASHLRAAIGDLHRILNNVRVSSFIDTEPVDVGPQPRFLNAAAAATTTLDAPALLARLLGIEGAHGRRRPAPGAARTLDLDLILYGDAIIDEPGLVVPHPRFRQRAFVLDPLAEIAPELIDPVTGKTIAALRLEFAR